MDLMQLQVTPSSYLLIPYHQYQHYSFINLWGGSKTCVTDYNPEILCGRRCNTHTQGGNKVLWNIIIILCHYMASQPRGPWIKPLSQWKHQISH